MNERRQQNKKWLWKYKINVLKYLSICGKECVNRGAENEKKNWYWENDAMIVKWERQRKRRRTIAENQLFK